MRTIETTVYTISELKDIDNEAFENALEELRNSNFNCGYAWAEEAHESLKLFCEEVGADWRGSCFDTSASADVRTGKIDDSILEIKGARLMSYLWNNYSHLIAEPKETWFVRRPDGSKIFNAVGENSGKYVSKCQYQTASCPFTGYCMDDSILKPLQDFARGKNFSHNTTFEDIINECVDAWITAAETDCQWQNSEEYLTEHAEINNYEFTEEGNFI